MNTDSYSTLYCKSDEVMGHFLLHIVLDESKLEQVGGRPQEQGLLINNSTALWRAIPGARWAVRGDTAQPGNYRGKLQYRRANCYHSDGEVSRLLSRGSPCLDLISFKNNQNVL